MVWSSQRLVYRGEHLWLTPSGVRVSRAPAPAPTNGNPLPAQLSCPLRKNRGCIGKNLPTCGTIALAFMENLRPEGLSYRSLAMFVHLHCHSHYSFLRGVNPPEEIIAAAVEQKMPAVALTDTNGMYAAVPFYQKALEANVKPIIGVVLEIRGEWRVTSGEFRRVKSEPRDSLIVPMVLLAMDMAGYSNLCQLTTIRHI